MNTPALPESKPAKRQGLTKCWIVWNNGWKKTYQSYDSSGRYQLADPREYGIRRLKKLVDKWGSTVAQAIIYDNRTGQKLESFQSGTWVPAD